MNKLRIALNLPKQYFFFLEAFLLQYQNRTVQYRSIPVPDWDHLFPTGLFPASAFVFIPVTD
jgi:hypothetical protein